MAAHPEFEASQFIPTGPGTTVPGRLPLLLARLVTYPRQVKRVDADVFHILDQGYAHLARSLPSRKVLVTCHDLTPFRIIAEKTPVPMSRATFARFRYSVRGMHQAARVACVSEQSQADVIRFLGIDPGKLEVIRPGLGKHFRPLGEEAVDEIRGGLALEGPALLHVDSGLPYKNVVGTLQILAALRSDGVAATLLRVGAPLRPEHSELAMELGVQDAVRNLGRVSDERLVELYNAANVFVFPSYHEGFGWPPLEAMACGTPVVVSDRGALLETVGGAALSAGPEDIDRLSSMVGEVLSRPELAGRLRTAGLARAAEFSWGRNAASYAEIYKRLAASD